MHLRELVGNTVGGVAVVTVGIRVKAVSSNVELEEILGGSKLVGVVAENDLNSDVIGGDVERINITVRVVAELSELVSVAEEHNLLGELALILYWGPRPSAPEALD